MTSLKNKNDKLTLSYLLNLLDGTLCHDNTFFIMTTNHVNNLDPALIRNGRVDVSIELKYCDHYQIASIYEKILKNPLESVILEKIKEYKHRPIDIINHILKMSVICDNVDDVMEFFYEKE